MGVDINITKKEYEFIDGATGEKLTPQEFAKRYPGLAVGGYAPSASTPTREERPDEAKEK